MSRRRLAKGQGEFNPHDYQKKAIKWMVSGSERILFLFLGAGKSAIELTAIKILLKARRIDRTLIIAPLRPCYSVWTKDEGGELWKWTNFHDLTVTLLHGKDKEAKLYEDSDIYVINHDGMKWLTDPLTGKRKKRINVLFERGVNHLCIDELSAFKNDRGQRSKCLRPYLGRFVKRDGLTATPAANGLIDLHGQVKKIDLGKRLGQYITQYRTKYFEPTGYKGYKWSPQEGAEERIYAALKDVALPMKAEDHLDLPPLVERDIYVNLPTKAKKIYESLEKEFLTAVDDGIITAANAGVASGKLRQIASGAVYGDETIQKLIASKDVGDEVGVVKRVVHQIHEEKIKALKEIIGELQGYPLLVAYNFNHDVERILEALGKSTPTMRGGVSAKKSAQIARAWNAGDIPVLVAHPAAMGHGMNMQGSGNHICWFSHTWNLEHYLQFNGRIHRQGIDAQRVFVHRLIARDTIDEVMAATIRSKNRVQKSLIEGIAEMQKRRRK